MKSSLAGLALAGSLALLPSADTLTKSTEGSKLTSQPVAPQASISERTHTEVDMILALEEPEDIAGILAKKGNDYRNLSPSDFLKIITLKNQIALSNFDEYSGLFELERLYLEKNEDFIKMCASIPKLQKAREEAIRTVKSIMAILMSIPPQDMSHDAGYKKHLGSLKQHEKLKNKLMELRSDLYGKSADETGYLEVQSWGLQYQLEHAEKVIAI